MRPAWRNQAENICLAKRDVQTSEYLRPAKEIDGPGICGVQRPFKVAALAGGTVTLNTDATLGCPMIPALDNWLAQVVQPVAQARFGANVTGMATMGSYACRSIDHQRGARLSEHAFANALDIGSFRLSDGREISIVRDWKGGDEQTKAFLREIHAGACQFFTTVLGPGADVFHYNHFHFDLAMHGNTSTGPRRYCKPLPQNQPAPPKLDDLPDPPMIEEEQEVAQSAPRAPALGVPANAIAAVRRPATPVPPLAIAAYRPPPPAAMPMVLMPRQPILPRTGSIGEDGVFVPEGNPDEWDITSLIEGRKTR